MASIQTVMSEILIEVPAELDAAAVAAAGERIRAAYGESAQIPPALTPFRSERQTRYTSSSGQLMLAAPDKTFLRMQLRLEHPANGGGRAGLDIAAGLIAMAIAEVGGSRAIYGSTGIAPDGCRDGFKAHWWSPHAHAQLAAIAEIAASGLSWKAPEGFSPRKPGAKA